VGPYNSWVNGSAMRVSPAALIAVSREKMLENTRQVSIITHDHLEGIKGALATVDAIYALQNGASSAEVRSFIEQEYDYPLNRTIDMIRPDYDFDVRCQGTVPEAIICALKATSFEDAIRNAISLGGDSDTLACITGALAEARIGVPEDLIAEANSRLQADMIAIMGKLYASAP
jgi:ADP-ribosyl-[dinitrogen reductase] hydrolase